MSHEQDQWRDYYFGVCPTCHRTDGYLNVGAAHWFCCHAHAVRWYVGDNLFSSWRLENEVNWAGNEALMKGYTDITNSEYRGEYDVQSDVDLSDAALERWFCDGRPAGQVSPPRHNGLTRIGKRAGGATTHGTQQDFFVFRCGATSLPETDDRGARRRHCPRETRLRVPAPWSR